MGSTQKKVCTNVELPFFPFWFPFFVLLLLLLQLEDEEEEEEVVYDLE